ncbi:MAK10-like protein [Tanacetum coccineum]
MEDKNPIRTLRDYSKPSLEGYRNTIELPEGNNVVPLRSDTIRTAKLRNNILMFQQHQGESLSEAWNRFIDLLQKVPHLGIDHWRSIQIFYDHVSFHLKCEIDRTAGGKLRNKNADESWEIIENLALYDHEGWNDSKNFVINDRMTEMFRLLKELTTSKAPKNALIKEEAKSPVTKNILVKEAEKENGAENRTKNEPIKRGEKEEVVEAPSSQHVEYYLKHMINEKLIEGLVDNHRGPVYKVILKKKITRKEDIGGNFEIPCNIGGLKHINALVDQGSDMNVMPLSTYMTLTDERPAETDIRLSLASHSYIYPLRIVEDVLVDVAGYVYPVDFMILDMKEDEKRPFILRTPFLTTAKAVIKFDKGTITVWIMVPCVGI